MYALYTHECEFTTKTSVIGVAVKHDHTAEGSKAEARKNTFEV